MKTLYFRIVFTLILILLGSGILGLFVTNAYYISNIQATNESRVLKIGEEIRELFEKNPELDINDYMTHIAALGYQIYVADAPDSGIFYGSPFRRNLLPTSAVTEVLQGGTYYGIQEKRQFLKVNNYFENSLRNSIGLPLDADGTRYAVFIRPNLEQQIGEVRILLSLLLGHTFIFSIAFIVICSRTIVRPIKKLTAATHKIVEGDYRITMDVSRQDEIGNLARDFTHMARSIEQLDQMRQEFVANVSHEFQSPLTSIHGFAHAVRHKEVESAQAEQYLEIIEEESKRLSSLSKQLLLLATLDKEDFILKKSCFRIDEQLRQVLILLEYQWTEKHIELDLELQEMTIRGDQQLLHQVWSNLITNAIKFSHPGGTIRITLEQSFDGIILAISDQGMGMAEEELPRIFDRFYKIDKNRSRSQGGSGLGLSIAQKIIRLHDGKIDVTSRLHEGTTFYVRLPQE